MNTMGKVLVVLNFVFALVVGAFLTLKFATETNYKSTNDQFQTELTVARKNNLGLAATNQALAADLSASRSSHEATRQDLALKEGQWAVKEAELRKEFKDAEDRGKLAEVNLEKALVAEERMKKEIDALKTTIGDREDRLIKLHTKYKDSQDLAMSLDRDLKFSQERNQILLARVQELERFVAELQTGTKADSASALPKDPTQPNPPPKFVKGRIETVDTKDNTLVRVSLGTDHGLKVNNTLEVYRLDPTPEYIGMIRIVDAHHHTSVGKLVRAPGTAARSVREGDVVSSSLNPR